MFNIQVVGGKQMKVTECKVDYKEYYPQPGPTQSLACCDALRVVNLLECKKDFKAL